MGLLLRLIVSSRRASWQLWLQFFFGAPVREEKSDSHGDGKYGECFREHFIAEGFEFRGHVSRGDHSPNGCPQQHLLVHQPVFPIDQAGRNCCRNDDGQRSGDGDFLRQSKEHDKGRNHDQPASHAAQRGDHATE